jgi:Transposase DDE domain group 1
VLNRELVAKGETIDSRRRVVLDMDSTEISVYGRQEQGAYNGHFETIWYHPLLLFNGEGDCLAAKLGPGSNLPFAITAGVEAIVNRLKNGNFG